MKSKFPGYFKLTDKEINELWKNALFTLDANILLNLYRYSDETREEFFKILNKLKKRIWIPHQSAQEFFNNRLGVISQQEKSYEETISSLKSIEKEFHNSRQHPFLSDKLLKKFTSLNEEICKQLEGNKEFHNNRITEDDILAKIESLFDKKVGNEFTEEELQEICKEGEIRFKNKVPPGYKDSSKNDDTELNSRKYGDFIVWKQIIQKSKDLKQGVILLTDDRKEDWWVRFKGKTISPRPELIKEFQLEAEQSFHMYQSDRFLEFARDFLNEKVDEKAIEEIRELRRLDERRRMMNLRKEEEYMKYRQVRESLMKERISLEEELNYLHERRSHLKNSIDEQYLILDNSDPAEFDERQLSRLKHELKMFDSKSDEIRMRLMSLKEREHKERMIRNKTMHNKGYSA